MASPSEIVKNVLMPTSIPTDLFVLGANCFSISAVKHAYHLPALDRIIAQVAIMVA